MITFEETNKGRTVYYVDRPEHGLEVGDVVTIKYKDGRKDVMSISYPTDTTCTGCHYNEKGMCPCYTDDEGDINCLADLNIFKSVDSVLEEL